MHRTVMEGQTPEKQGEKNPQHPSGDPAHAPQTSEQGQGVRMSPHRAWPGHLFPVLLSPLADKHVPGKGAGEMWPEKQVGHSQRLSSEQL